MTHQGSWQDAYFAVVFELDRTRLPERIEVAEAAMSKRSHELVADLEHETERALLVQFSEMLGHIKRRALLPNHAPTRRTA